MSSDSSETESLLARQDADLERLSETVGRMKHTAVAISGELNSQNELLEVMIHRSDDTEKRLQSATVEADKLHPKHNRGGCILIIIILILIIVLILVLSLPS